VNCDLYIVNCELQLFWVIKGLERRKGIWLGSDGQNWNEYGRLEKLMERGCELESWKWEREKEKEMNGEKLMEIGIGSGEDGMGGRKKREKGNCVEKWE